MRVRTSGTGPDVVLIHGWSASGRMMEPIAMALDERFTCHVVDLPGHGFGVEGRVDPSLGDLVAAVDDYVAGLANPPVLIGWAMGALIALGVGARRSLRGIVGIGTASGGGELGPAFEKMASRMARDWPRYVRSSVDAIVGDRVSPEMHAFVVETMQQTPPSLARRTLLDVARTDAKLWAADVACPVLYQHGAEDVISPLAVARALEAATPQATLKVYDGIGHAPFLETREPFLADLDHFLGGLDD